PNRLPVRLPFLRLQHDTGTFCPLGGDLCAHDDLLGDLRKETLIAPRARVKYGSFFSSSECVARARIGPHVFGPESWKREIDRIFMRGWLNLVQITFARAFGESVQPDSLATAASETGHLAPHSDTTTARKG